MNTLQDTVRAQFEVNKKQKARLRNNRRISEEFEDYGGYAGRLPDSNLGPIEHNRFRSGSASTSEGTIESGVASRMRERDADAMAEYIRRRDQRDLEARRDGESRPDVPFHRQRSASSSSSGAPESSIASGVGGSVGSANGSLVNGSRRPSASNANKALPPPPPLSSIHPFAAAASQFSTPTQFPTPLQSQFSPPSNLPLDSYTQHARNHPIAGEPMAPPASPGRRLRAVASANALGAVAMAQAPRPKRAGTNEGLGTSPGQAYMGGRSVSAIQSRSGSVSRPPPAMPPPTVPLPAAPGPTPPTPPPKSGPASSSNLSRETPKREMSSASSGRETPKSGKETPKSGKDGKETPGRTTLGLRAGVVGVVKPILSPSALNGSFFSRGDKSSSSGSRPVEASR
ncbi:hypothetical protein FRC09_009993 [Ceratobasidium sp. 395]|nr:hypothetical protein FRC09_009993 [Ceratobasidium sp. 395]